MFLVWQYHRKACRFSSWHTDLRWSLVDMESHASSAKHWRWQWDKLHLLRLYNDSQRRSSRSNHIKALWEVAETAGEDNMNWLFQALERHQEPARDSCKAPKFYGTDDLDYFIPLFTDIWASNRYDSLTTRLHLREALTGVTQTYLRAEWVIN